MSEESTKSAEIFYLKILITKRVEINISAKKFSSV